MPKGLFRRVLFFFTYREATRLLRAFEEATKKPEQVQEQALLSKIRRMEDSDFGKEHGFKEIKSVEDFRKRLPLREYDYFQPYIERLKEGDFTALLGKGEKVLMFALTSGSTGEPKYIPVTKTFLKEYSRSSLLWGAYAYLDHPDLIENRILPIVSSMHEKYTPTGIPCGAASGMHARSQKYLGRSLYAVPDCVFDIPDAESKYYAIMRCALTHEVGLVSSPNPSTLIRIARIVDENKEQLIKDIHDGTLDRNREIPEDIAREIIRRCAKNPERARELERIARREGTLYPKDFWKHIVLIGCWKGGSLTSYLPLLPKYYGDVPIRDVGLIASEGRMTIPMSDEGCAGVLDVTGSFYEFIREEDEDTENPDTLLCHELEEGKRYFIILTTSSGLFRYHIRDLVQVVGFHNRTPLLAFMSKGKRISSLTGEKLTENQVVEAVNAAARDFSLHLETFTMCPCWDEVPFYALYIEEDSIPEGLLRKFVLSVDGHLRKLNIEYESKRKSGRLKRSILRLVPNGTFETIRAEHIKRSGRPEQYKHTYLLPNPHDATRFKVLREIAPDAP